MKDSTVCTILVSFSVVVAIWCLLSAIHAAWAHLPGVVVFNLVLVGLNVWNIGRGWKLRAWFQQYETDQERP